MSRWFRHYAGMMRDDKLVSAAVKSKQPVERVVWVWGAILESAGEINDGGRYEFDCGEAAYFLRCDESDLASIVANLEALGRLAGGVVSRWGDRQFASDAAAERQRRYRERKSGRDVEQDGGDHNGDAYSDVTQPSRDGAVTPQETETELDTEDKTARPVLDLRARDLFSELVEAFPQNPSSSETKARAAFERIKPTEKPDVVLAAQRYSRWFAQDCEARSRTIDAGLRYVPHLGTWLDKGEWREAAKLPVKGEQSPDVVVIVRGDEDFAALERLRGKPINVFTEDGHYTVAKAELERARNLESVH